MNTTIAEGGVDVTRDQIAQPLPTRVDLAEVIEAEILDFFDWPGLHPDLPFTVADAVLNLLEGRDG